MIAAGVHHISFAVSDLARSRRFYEDVLELEPIPRPELGLPGMWYRAGSSEVHLIATPPGASVGTPPDRLSSACSRARPLTIARASASGMIRCRPSIRACAMLPTMSSSSIR